MGAIQIRTVLSSEAEASMSGLVGFQLTLFTVPEWPSSCANKSPLSLCQTCTRQSCIISIAFGGWLEHVLSAASRIGAM